MKKYLIFASAALLAFAACNKVQEKNEPMPKNGNTILTLTTKKPQLDADTRTQWDPTSRSVIWSTGDQIRVGYTFEGQWMGKSEAGSPKFYISDNVSVDSNDPNVGTFTVPLGESAFTDPESQGSYVFYGFYPYKAGSVDAVSSQGVATLTLPVNQTPGVATFDKAADIMIGKTETVSSTGIPEDPIEISWSRIVAHVDISFVNMPFGQSGTETVSEIILTSSGKLAGPFTVDFESGDLGTEDAVETILVSAENITADANSLETWVSVLPGAFTSLDIEIKTDKATYTRSISGLSNKAFKQNARNTLTINMATADRTENLPASYTLYSGDLSEGVYIIYDATDGHALKAAISNNRFTFADVTPEDNVILTNDESILWYIAPADGNYFTIFNEAIQKYAAATSSNNQGQLLDSGSDEKSLWTVSDTYDFVNKSNQRYLRSNGNSGFACYAATTGHTLQLYKFDSREALDAPSFVIASLSPSVTNAINVNFDDGVTNADTYVISAIPVNGGDIVTLAGVTQSPATIVGLAYNTMYSVSVYAVPASDDLDHKRSAATEVAEPVTTGDKPTTPEGYELITSTNDVTAGLYIIAAKVGDKYYAMPNAFSVGKPDGVLVSVTDGVVPTSDAADYSVSLTKNNNTYTIQGSGKLLGWTSGTDFKYTGAGTEWTLSSGANGTFRLTNVASTSTNTKRAVAFTGTVFGAYAISNITQGSTSYYDVELFKFNGVVKTTPTITVTPNSPINLEVGQTQQLTVNTNSDGAVTYETSDDEIATVTSDGLISAVAKGNATITVKTAETNEFYAVQETITVNVSDGPSTIAEVIAAAANTSVYTSGVVVQVNLKGFIITDGNDNILVYQNVVPTVVVGQSVVVRGARSIYNNVAQVSGTTNNPLSVEAGATGQTVVRTSLTTVTSSNAKGYTTSEYVSLTGKLTQSGNYFNVAIAGSETAGSLYQVNSDTQFPGGTLSSLVNKVVTVTGYVAGSTDSYLNIAAVDIVEDANAPVLSISPATSSSDPASWPADNDDAKSFTVSATNGTWAISDQSTVSGWATVSTSGNVITVTPLAKQATEAHSGSIVVTLTPHEGYEAQTATIYLAQAKYSPAGGETYVLTSSQASGQAYQYTVNTITETDGSVWNLFGYGKNNALWQLGGNKGSGDGAAKCSYILTPTCSGDITSITVNCQGANYVAIYSSDASTLLAEMVKKPASTSVLGDLVFTLPSGYTQVKIMFTTNSNGSLSAGTNAACYINSVTVTTE